MSAARILVTGASGQLGQCLKATIPEALNEQVIWADKEQLDISNSQQLSSYFESHKISHCINTAAYTAVDQAESAAQQAFLINATAVHKLAELCAQHEVVLIHPSTDYVFDGKAAKPYEEDDPIAPPNVYGASKAAGEVAIRSHLKQHFIIRTSWLYSPYKGNFYTAIRKKLLGGESLKITTEQTGTPTNGLDLASFNRDLIVEDRKEYGTYHYSNTGLGTWFDFAMAIAEGLGKNYTNQLASTAHYATFAARPAYSVLSKEKIKATFDVQPPDWKDSLHQLTQHE